MDLQPQPPAREGAVTALDRARLVSQALADAARRARFSTRSRRRSAQGGFGARKGQSAFFWGALLSFLLLVAVPSVVSAVYYIMFATDQYVTDFKFTVTGNEPPLTDGVGMITGIPTITIIQDTQIVVNYWQTRAALEALDQRIGLRQRYSRPEVDWYARFNPEKPIEKFLRYWRWMHSASLRMPSGIVEISVKAFSPRDAYEIGRAMVELSEQLVNDMNTRMNRDAVESAESDLERAAQRLRQARISLEQARNSEGILDATKAAEGLTTLITETRSTLLQLRQEFQTQLRFVAETAPQMQALRVRIQVTEQQLRELESRLTSVTGGAGSGQLSAAITRFSELELERQIAERIYAGAVASLELARISSERKRIYLNSFVLPSEPQESRQPQRALMIFAVLVGSFTLWAGLVGLIAVIRNHMA